MPQTAWVFDSWALLAFLEDERPAATKVEELILQAHENNIAMMISTINMGEIWYSLKRTRSEKDADFAITQTLQLGFQIIDIDWPLTLQAANYKAKYRIAYADCFAAALAHQHNTRLITGDKEFVQLEDDIEIRWV